MPMTADKLKVYLASKDLAADGDPISQRVADAGGAFDKIVDAGLPQADGFWNGALGWFDPATTTAALRGLFFHVKTWDSVTKTLTLTKQLPAVPGTGDTYRLVLGGSFRSSSETFGMALDTFLPELFTVAGVNITGLTIKKASGMLGAQTLTLSYNSTTKLLFAKVGAEAYGVGLDVSANVVNGYVYTADGNSWVRVSTIFASLPGSDQVDTWELTYPERTLTPDFEGYETRSPVLGKTRYRLEVVKNEGASSMTALTAIAGRPAGVTTALDVGQSLGLGAGSFDIVDATSWPTTGFWIYNQTKNDCRYVDYRSGLTLACFAVDWAILNFDAGSDEILPGDLVEGVTSLASAYADQVVLTSGTWAGGTAAGYLLLKGISGTFLDNETLKVGATTKALANGASVKGLRGFTAVGWVAGDVVMPLSDVDLGRDDPLALAFENPASETIAPAGVVFAPAFTVGTALALGNLAVGATMGIWRREWLEYNHQTRQGINADTVYNWT